MTAAQQLPTSGTAYVHFKGGTYAVVANALDSETKEAVVIYRSQQTGQLWVRATAALLETVMVDGVPTPRFTAVDGR